MVAPHLPVISAPHPRVIVALDTQLAVGTATGIGVYQRDLANALRTEHIEVRTLNAPWLNPWRFDRRVLWDQALLPLASHPQRRNAPARKRRHDALHPHAANGRHRPRLSLAPRAIPHALVRTHVLRHAASPRIQARRGDRLRLELQRERIPRADRTCDAQIDVVYPGVDPRFATLERRKDPSPFALVVGTVEARKNLLVLIEALPSLPSLRIIAVGPPTPYADAVRARAAELNVADRVELRGYHRTQRAR